MDPTELDQLIEGCGVALEERKCIAPLSHEAVETLRRKHALSVMDFCDAFARHVAHQYSAERLSFTAGDAAMNALSAYVLNHFDVTLPSYAADVYHAFDEGEYIHESDGKDVDPEEKYTRPAIQSIVIRDQVLRDD